SVAVRVVARAIGPDDAAGDGDAAVEHGGGELLHRQGQRRDAGPGTIDLEDSGADEEQEGRVGRPRPHSVTVHVPSRRSSAPRSAGSPEKPAARACAYTSAS